MWNMIMRAFGEGLEQEEMEGEFHFVFSLLYVSIVLLVLLAWVNDLIENQIHYKRERNEVSLFSFVFNSNILFHSFFYEFSCFFCLIVQGHSSRGEEESLVDEKRPNGFLCSECIFPSFS